MDTTEKPYFSADDKLAAMRDLNAQWRKAMEMPPGDDRERYLSAVNKVAAKVAEVYDMPMAGEGPLDTVAQGALKAINYGAGLVQAPILAGAEAVAGPKGKWLDVLKSALDPRKPNVAASEVAADIGIPPGPKLSDVLPGYAEPGQGSTFQPEKGGALDPTARGAGAAAFDFLVSPGGASLLKSAASRGAGKLTASEIQLLEKAARDASLVPPSLAEKARSAFTAAADPLGHGWSAAGQKMYASPFQAADRATVGAGALPVSEVLARHNVWGSPATIAEKAGDISKRVAANVRVDLGNAVQKRPGLTMPLSDVVDRANRELEHTMGIGGRAAGAAEAGTRLEQEIADAYGTRGKPGSVDRLGLTELNDLKQSMQGKARQQRAYLAEPPNPSRGVYAADNMAEAEAIGDAYKSVARSARRGVENLADEADPGLGGKIYKQNAELSSLAEAQDLLDKNAAQSLGTKFDKNWPAILTSGAMGGGAAASMGYHDPFHVAMGAALGAAASSTAVRTGVGLGLMKSAPWGSNAIRTYLDQKYNPWLRNHEPFNE